MYGLVKDAKDTEVIEKIDETTAIRYRVVQERIDLGLLEEEKAANLITIAELEGELVLKSESYLSEVGDAIDFYNAHIDSMKQSLLSRNSAADEILDKV